MGNWLGLPLDASAHGARVDNLLGIIHIFMLVLFIGWGVFFTFILFRFRQKKNPKADYAGVKTHASSYLEVAVAIIEVILLVGFSIPLWAKVVVKLPDEKDAVVLRVVAEQFAWNIHYPGPDGKFGRTDIDSVDATSNPLGLCRSDPDARDDITTINQLHLPVGKPALIYLSTKDVIHSFSLPVMRVKQDAIPGMRIPVTFMPVVPGDYEIACAQLCGLGHYRMRGFMTIHTPEGFAQWMNEQEAALTSGT
ncbi:MAG: hypothetical protein HY304_02580 [candidate division Zixibacteria bacterium]|nr:hypothetical protein [candidate division Zixibacteria bacterium]